MNSHLSGLLLLDKPTGISSHTAVRKAARALGSSKAGHSGTLDPLASGLLLVGVGRASRLLEFLVGVDKSYRAVIKLGVLTSTLDREGEVIEECEVLPLAEGDILAALGKFTGPITQIPPAVSAIKSGGVPLYKLARKGKEVEPPPREVEIFSLKLLKWESPFLEIEARVSSGTYIRSLARDIGRELGALGTVWELRRLSVGNFGVEEALTLDELAQKGGVALLPLEKMVDALPKAEIDDSAAAAFCNGIAAEADENLAEGADAAVFSAKGELLGIARREGKLLRPRKVLFNQQSNDSLP